MTPRPEPAHQDLSGLAARASVSQLTVRTTGSALSVVEDVSLEVGAGEILGIVGESGSGKTTLGLALLAHARRGLRIAGGSVRLDGTNLLELSPGELRRLRGAALAYVPQDPGTALNPALRIGTQLEEVLAAHGRGREVRERVAEVLTEVGLPMTPELLAAYPHQLSGGQQQRVTLAIAFACRPSLIVLDEPTTGLDVTTQRRVLDTVRELCRTYRVAAVYISHDVVVVSTLADRVAVVYAGRVIELGNTEAVFNTPAHPYTIGLLDAVPSPTETRTLRGMAGIPPRPGRWPQGCAFADRCPHVLPECRDELPALFEASPGHSARCVLVEAGRPGRQATPRGGVDAPTASADFRPVGAGAPLLELRRVTAAYGARAVLHDIELAVPERACLAVVGESGSGKTTLARCISGLHSRWQGEVCFAGEQLPTGVRGRSVAARRGLQYVFQNPYASLNPRRTVGGLVAQPLEEFERVSAAERLERVVEALRSAALPPEVLERYPDQLSGGERQRVAIARALVLGPRLLICDEITSALDVSVQAAVVELLRHLQHERGLAMLFITHNLALVRSIAQDVVVMQQGRIVESGSVADVLDHPTHPYTQRLLEDVPEEAPAAGHAAAGRA